MPRITDPFKLNMLKNGIRKGTLLDTVLKNHLDLGELDAKELIKEGVLTQEKYDQLYYVDPRIKEKEEEEKRREAERLAQMEREAKEAEANKIRDEIEANIKSGSYSDDDIIEFCEKKILNENDLVSRNVITQRRKDELFPGKVVVQFSDWEHIPPLVENRVDVFVLGIQSSGKSCLMAGLLRYADKEGKMISSIDNVFGYQYINTLTNAVKRGQTPPATSEDHVQYMACDFIDEKQKKHPLTFIEMSGEMLQKKVVMKTKDQIPENLKKYFFENPNRKIIFLAVDYDLSFEDTPQSIHFNYILQFFDKHGMLKKDLEAIILVITKWDKCSDKSPGAAESFLKDKHLNLITLCQDYKDKYGIDFRIFKFSLGDFKNSFRYTYKEEYSKIIFDMLCKSSPYKEGTKKVGLFNKLFGK